MPQKQKTRVLIELIGRANPSRAIVFSRTKHGADRIVRQMVAAGLRAEAIHANKSQNKRQRILEEFKSSSPPILVATDIAARGIDVDLVSHVFNHDMPTEEETYVHRIGRSGRAGATGIAVSLCDPEERRMLRSIEKLIGQTIEVDRLEGIELAKLPAESAESGDDHPSRRPRQRRDGRTPRPESRERTRTESRAEGSRTERPRRDGDRRDSGQRDGGQRDGDRRQHPAARAAEEGPRRFRGHAARREEERASRQRSGTDRAPQGQRERAQVQVSGTDRNQSQRTGHNAEEHWLTKQKPQSRSPQQRSSGARASAPRSPEQRSSGSRTNGQRQGNSQRQECGQSRRNDDLTFGDGLYTEERNRRPARSSSQR